MNSTNLRDVETLLDLNMDALLEAMKSVQALLLHRQYLRDNRDAFAGDKGGPGNE